METVSLFMVFILFVKDNENAEYDNLKVIAEVNIFNYKCVYIICMCLVRKSYKKSK